MTDIMALLTELFGAGEGVANAERDLAEAIDDRTVAEKSIVEAVGYGKSEIDWDGETAVIDVKPRRKGSEVADGAIIVITFVSREVDKAVKTG